MSFLKSGEKNYPEESFFPKGYFLKITFLIFILFMLFFWSLASGSVKLTFTEIYQLFFQPERLGEETLFILKELRLFRILLAIVVGLSLGVSGMVLQGVFRNPLVDPFIIGVSGGASLGAGLAILFKLKIPFLAGNALPLFAFLGSLIAIFFCYRLSLTNYGMSIERLLLGGVAISSLTSSLLSLILVIKGENTGAVIFWIMGSLSGKGSEEFFLILPYIFLVLLIIFFNLHRLNILQLGDEAADNLGINTEKMKLLMILSASLLAAVVVSISGVIGFVGLIVPQMSRLLIQNSDYRILLPVVILLGAIVLLAADSFARLLLIPQEIPVGIFTSMLGVPFFLFLLQKSGSSNN